MDGDLITLVERTARQEWAQKVRPWLRGIIYRWSDDLPTDPARVEAWVRHAAAGIDADANGRSIPAVQRGPAGARAGSSPNR